MAGFDNDVVYCDNYDFSGGSPVTGQVTQSGQLPIGTGNTPAIKVGKLTSTTLTIGYSDPNITIEAGSSMPTDFNADVGSATPAGNILNLSGGTGIDTSASGNTVTFDFDETEVPTIATTYTADTGSATPAANNLNVLGSTSINTSGSGSTLNIAWDDRMFLMPAGHTINLGISLSSGTFSVTGADGTALSASNPGWVVVPSAVNPGQLVAHMVTADQSFDDSSAGGGSNIVDNLFGLTSGDNWGANDIPFFIYAVAQSDDSSVQFMISRNPGKQSSPVAAKIGDTAAAGTSAQSQFFALGSITEANFAVQPCVPIGCFRMRFTQPCRS